MTSRYIDSKVAQPDSARRRADSMRVHTHSSPCFRVLRSCRASSSQRGVSSSIRNQAVVRTRLCRASLTRVVLQGNLTCVRHGACKQESAPGSQQPTRAARPPIMNDHARCSERATRLIYMLSFPMAHGPAGACENCRWPACDKVTSSRTVSLNAEALSVKIHSLTDLRSRRPADESCQIYLLPADIPCCIIDSWAPMRHGLLLDAPSPPPRLTTESPWCSLGSWAANVYRDQHHTKWAAQALMYYTCRRALDRSMCDLLTPSVHLHSGTALARHFILSRQSGAKRL